MEFIANIEIGLMRARLEKLKRLTVGASIAEAIINGTQNVIRTEGGAYGTGASTQTRFNSQRLALGGRR